MKRRPLSITIIGWISILVGVGGLLRHGWEAMGDVRRFGASGLPRVDEWAAILIVELAALAGGAYLLRGRNFARWLLLAWMGFHVGLSAMHSIPETVVHLAFLIVLVYFLFSSKARVYFQAGRAEASPNSPNQTP